MAHLVREQLYDHRPQAPLSGEVEGDDIHLKGGRQGQLCEQRPARQRGLKQRGRGTYQDDRPLICLWTQRHSPKMILEMHTDASKQEQLIGHLNPIIKGWTAYYAPVCSKKTFAKMAHLTYLKLKRWAKWRHPRKSWRYVSHKYWRLERGRWDFAPSKGSALYKHYQTSIKRHIKVKGTKSPYDGDWVYWAKRRGQQPGLPKRTAILLKRQSGKCAARGLYFSNEDKLEIDHIIPRAQGGADGYDNWQLLHTHCHHQKTVQENRARWVRSTYDKGQSTEKRCAPKGARTVLKQCQRG